MKKIAIAFALTFSAFAMRVPGFVTYGPFLNCEIENNTSRTVQVLNYEYTIRYYNGAMKRDFFICTFNCELESMAYNNFSGPLNQFNIYDATCSATIQPIRRRR